MVFCGIILNNDLKKFCVKRNRSEYVFRLIKGELTNKFSLCQSGFYCKIYRIVFSFSKLDSNQLVLSRRKVTKDKENSTHEYLNAGY